MAIEADGNLWVYGMALATVGIWWQFGTPAGIGAAVVGLLLYYTLARSWMRRRLMKRAAEASLWIEKWQAMWRLGGITLTQGDQRCAAPDGNWMEFVRRSAAAAG